jgi:actin-related protein
MSIDPDQVLVIDVGSDTTKAGLASSYSPSHVFPSLITRSTDPPIRISPRTRGVVNNWNDLQQLWSFVVLETFHIEPGTSPVVIADYPSTESTNREKTAQIFFEVFGVPFLYIGCHGPLSLFASGRTTGVVCDLGYGVSHIFPIYESAGLIQETSRLEFGGYDIDIWTQKILKEKFPAVLEFDDLKNVEKFKIEKGYVALDFEAELGKGEGVRVGLADGSELGIANEHFRGPELLFKPSLNDFEYGGLHKEVVNVISRCPINLRRDLHYNIVVIGGSSLFRGLQERLEGEVKKLAPQGTRVAVAAEDDRQYAAWTGGAVLASLELFESVGVSRQAYNEVGPAIIKQKLP